jgi:NADH:ubiquinone oxidoreductase subunit 2 (subunit N)
LLSLIGVPLTGGFFGKFYVFRAALDAGLAWLTVLGLLTSAVAAYYYLRILVVMYMREPAEATEPLPPQGAALKLALWACAAGTLLLGIFPSASQLSTSGGSIARASSRTLLAIDSALSVSPRLGFRQSSAYRVSTA